MRFNSLLYGRPHWGRLFRNDERMKRITIETVLFILLSMLIENAIFAQNLPKIISEQLNLYAVNSFEGLRVRSAPSLEGRKIGLLEYQETVECLSIDDKTVVLDNITSNWFKVKAVHKDLEGYVFGGYLTPLHSVEYSAADKSLFKIDSEKIYSLVNEGAGIKTDWNLEDGIYVPSQIFIQFPIMHSRCLNDKDFGLVVKNSRLYYFMYFNRDLIVYDTCYDTEVDSFYKPELKENKKNQKEFVVYLNEKSGGGECVAISFDGESLYITDYFRSFGSVYRESCMLKKLSPNNKTIKMKYKYSFPYFVNVSGLINASSSIKNINKSDIQIRGNQRKVLTEYDGWGPLSEGGEKNIVELTDCLVIDGKTFYKGIYRGKEVFIKSKDLTASLYISKELLDEKISSEWGM